MRSSTSRAKIGNRAARRGDHQHAAARLSTLEQELQADRAGQSIQLGMLPKQNKVMAGLPVFAMGTALADTER